MRPTKAVRAGGASRRPRALTGSSLTLRSPYAGYDCVAGLYGEEAINLLKRFYETANPNIPESERDPNDLRALPQTAN